MRDDQRGEDGRKQQDMDRVEARNQFRARELTAEKEHGEIGADDRYRQDGTLEEPEPGARQQVVRQRVSDESLEHAEDQHDPAEQPVHFPGLAEGAREEVAHHVDEHSGDENESRPVMHLADEEPATYVEGDVERGGEGLRHADAVERDVAALVHDLVHRGMEEEGEVDPRQHQHDEAPQTDLAQHERPVVREDLPHIGLGDGVQAQPGVRPVGQSLSSGRLVWVLGVADRHLELFSQDRVSGSRAGSVASYDGVQGADVR